MPFGRFWATLVPFFVTLALTRWAAQRLTLLRAAQQVRALPAYPPAHLDECILMLAPHPDDEVLGAGGYLQQCVQAGAQVHVVWITGGDAFECQEAQPEEQRRMRELGVRRMAEARQAADILGIAPQAQHALGYPDGGLQAMLDSDSPEPYHSVSTGTSAVYLPGCRTPQAPYTRRALSADLSRLLDELRPDRVLSPSPQELHPEHASLGPLMRQLMTERGELDRLWFWVVHGGKESVLSRALFLGSKWPLPKEGAAALPLPPAPVARTMPWRRVDLTPGQQALKREAIRAHHSQFAVLGRFLAAYDRPNELLVAARDVPPV